MKLNYCTDCASPLEAIDKTQYRCGNGHDYWNNPRATADVAIINENGQILVSKRAHEPDKGKYDLPGGFIQYEESAEDAAIREVKEETGLTVTSDNLELIFSCPGPYLENEWLITTIFLVRRWQGNPVAADDSEALEWQTLDFLESKQFALGYDGLRPALESRIAT